MPRARFEAWTLPTDATFRKILDVPALAGTNGTRELSNYADNTAMVQANWEGRDQVGSALMRRFVGSKVTDEWIVRRIDKAIQRPGQYELSGPQINGIMEGLVVYPATEHANVQDWIWDGDNILPSLKLADLNHINETYELYLSGERYVLDLDSATGGTFTLTALGDTTGTINFDASASSIRNALESLSGINEVSVVRPDPDEAVFQIAFENPKDLGSDMTADFGAITGSASLVKGNDGFDPGTNPTFTLTVDGQTTEPLPWNASAGQIEGVSETLTPPGSGLQGLSNVDDVTVQGSGTLAEPWVIVFHVPPAVGSLTVSFPAGQHVLRRTQEGLFDPSPITQSQFPDQRFDEQLHGKYGEPPIEVVTDPAFLNADFADSEWTLLVRAEGQFAGSQLLNGVEPHQTYQTAIPVRATVDGRYRLVIRDVSENLIKWTSPTEVPIAADGQYHWLEVPDVTMPAGTSIANMRIAVVSADESEIADFYVDWQHAQFVEGRPAATWTEIVRILVQHGQARGAFGFLDLDFTDTHDSAGNELDPESFTAFAFSNLDNVLSDGDAMGYKWRVVAKATPAGGKTHDLQIFYGGEAEDLTASSGGPTVQAGAVRDASVVSRTPEFTVAVGWGSEGIYVEVEDAALVAEFGRIEKVFDAEHLTSEESLTRLLEEKLREQATNADALTAEVDDDAQQVPLVDYAEGSKIWWAFPDQDVSKVAKVVERVSWVEGVASSTYTLNGSEELSEYGAMARAVDHLLRQFKVRRRNRQKTTPAVQGGGGTPTVVVAAVDASDMSKSKADFICSGVDDQNVINQAIAVCADGGRVLLTEGSFICSDTIVLPFYVWLQGVGPKTYIETEFVGNGTAVDATGFGCAVSDMIIDVQSSGSPTQLRALHISGDARAWNLTLFSGQVALALTGGGFGDGFYYGIDAYGDKYGLHVEGGFGHRLFGCKFAGVSAGVFVDSGQQQVLSDCYILSQSGPGITGNSTAYLLIDGCHITEVGTWAVDLTAGMADVQVQGCSISTVAGIRVTDAVGVSLRDNTIAAFESHGIEVAADNVQVVGNRVEECQQHGIVVSGDYAQVEGNYVYQPGGAAVNTYDGIIVSGNSNMVAGNTVIPRPGAFTRYGIDVLGDSNLIVGNMLGDPADYGTDDTNDGGVDNQWTLPGTGGGGVTDHGDLTGLTDDDHPQYLTEPEHNALDHADATTTAVWMPLTTVVAGEPELVWDANDSLIPTKGPI